MDRPSGRAALVVFVVLGVWGGVGGCWTEGVDKVLHGSARIWTSAPERPIGELTRKFELNPGNINHKWFSFKIVIQPVRNNSASNDYKLNMK